MTPSRPTLWTVLLLAALSAGCSSAAIIARHPGAGGPVVGRIQSSSDQNVYLGDDEASSVAVPREDIQDIDHPGNVVGLVGGILTVYGVFNIAVGAGQCDTRGGAFCTGVFLPAAVGVPMMIWGAATYYRSTAAAKPQLVRRRRLHVTFDPIPRAYDGNRYLWLGLGASY